MEFYDSIDGDLAGRALKFDADEVDKVFGVIRTARRF